MDEAKKQRLEAKGWKVGSVEEFLALTPAEAAYIEVKLTLSDEFDAQQWDEQIEYDLEAGGLDALLAEVDQEYEAGLAEPLSTTIGAQHAQRGMIVRANFYTSHTKKS